MTVEDCFVCASKASTMPINSCCRDMNVHVHTCILIFLNGGGFRGSVIQSFCFVLWILSVENAVGCVQEKCPIRMRHLSRSNVLVGIDINRRPERTPSSNMCQCHASSTNSRPLSSVLLSVKALASYPQWSSTHHRRSTITSFFDTNSSLRSRCMCHAKL